jgi:peptidoglycan/LPS O-acetylase OafA/YrhL
VAWPLVVVLTLRLRGRRVALTVISAVLTAAVVAVRYKVWLDARQFRADHYYEFERVGQRIGRAWNTVYFGSFTHSDGLLVGCVLAALLGLHPRTPRRVVRIVVGVLALAAVVVNVVIARRVAGVFAPTFMTTWGQITFNVGGAVLIAHILFSPGAPLPRLLATRPLVWVGRRSYGIYVLHIFFLEGVTSVERNTLPWIFLALGLSVAAAGVSYRYYEAPILRLKNRFNAVG